MGQKIKAPELMKARNDLIKFLKANDLDPAKDYSKDPKYGKEYRRLLLKLNVERDKVMVNYPNSDIKNRKKYFKMKKDKQKKAKTSKEAVAVDKKETKKKVEKKDKAPRTTKYDYPLIDGREMTSAEKKKYRTEQRKKANPKPEKPAKEKKAKKEKVEKKAKKTKKEKKAKKKVED